VPKSPDFDCCYKIYSKYEKYFYNLIRSANSVIDTSICNNGGLLVLQRCIFLKWWDL